MKVSQEITRAVGLEVLSVNEENRYVDFVISNETEDSHGTVFKNDKWRLDRYNFNPVFTYNHHDHSNDPDDTLGTSQIRFEDGNMIARAYFEDGDPEGDNNQKADKVFRKAKKGTLRGASIRAMVYEADYGDKEKGEKEETLYFSDQELVAWSVVTIPSNHTTLSRSTKSLEAIRSAIAKNTDVDSEPVDGNSSDNDTPEVDKTLSRFEAQLMLNENSIQK